MTGQRWLAPLDATTRLSRAQLRAYQAALVERELAARARLSATTAPSAATPRECPTRPYEQEDRAMPENMTVVVGNLTDDPELRYTPNGVAVTNFRLAVTPRVKDKDGSWRNGETTFVPVNVWRETAVNVAESDIGKGSRVVVCGRLRTRSWETEVGERRSVTELDADEVAPSLRFHIVKDVHKPDRSRDPAGPDRARGREHVRAVEPDDVPF